MPRVIWFRQSLRLDDNLVLDRAVDAADNVLPLFVFDPRLFASTKLGFPKTGAHRAGFLLQSVADLRRSLRERSSDLIVRVGYPETIIPEIVETLNASAVYTRRETTVEELQVDAAIEEALPNSARLERIWDDTLLHIDDLPFAVVDLPAVFTTFRKRSEASTIVRPPISAPANLPPLPDHEIDAGEIPTVTDLGLEETTPDPRRVIDFNGGERPARERVESYFWSRDALRRYKKTRNGLLGEDYSSKLSPWLAQGCISPRRIYDEVQSYELERIRNDSTYWLVFELLWRDFFRFTSLKEGSAIFKPGGITNDDRMWRRDPDVFDDWRFGRTGQPFVDANMIELNQTGFMSNRGRQNVASYLAHDLGIDWTWGAAWFESRLIDYDVASNWGNWAYVSAVGNDPRARRFNVERQAKMYDASGAYVSRWLEGAGQSELPFDKPALH